MQQVGVLLCELLEKVLERAVNYGIPVRVTWPIPNVLATWEVWLTTLLSFWWGFLVGLVEFFYGLWIHLGLFELDKEYLKNKTQPHSGIVNKDIFLIKSIELMLTLSGKKLNFYNFEC